MVEVAGIEPASITTLMMRHQILIRDFNRPMVRESSSGTTGSSINIELNSNPLRLLTLSNGINLTLV